MRPVIVEEEREPSYFNRHLATGAKVGMIAALGVTAALAIASGPAGAAALLSTGVGPWAIAGASGMAGLLIGAGSGIGCIRGREYIARNRQEGRVVNPPSIFNEGMAQGLLNGAMLGLAGLTITALTIGTGGLALGLAGGLGIGATALLGYAQGDAYQDKMLEEYNQAAAKAQRQQQGMLQKLIGSISKEKSRERETSVTPEESKALNERLREGQNREKNWQDTVRANHQQATEIGA